MANCIPGPNLRRLLVSLHVERESVWLATQGHHLVHRRHHRLLRCHCPCCGIRSDSQIVGKSLTWRADIQGSRTTMSVRDLLTFNLFLQFADGLVSYQAFALGAAEANPVVAAAIVNWGMIGGLVYNKTLACVLLLLIFTLRRSHLLAMRALTVTASVYVCATIVCLWELLR